MYGPHAHPRQSTQNVRIGAAGLLVMMFGVIAAMMAMPSPTTGMVLGSYASVILGLVVFSVAVGRSDHPTWLKTMVWITPAFFTALPVIAFLFT